MIAGKEGLFGMRKRASWMAAFFVGNYDGFTGILFFLHEFDTFFVVACKAFASTKREGRA